MTDMNRFVIKTLGCKVNQSESESMASALRQKGLAEFKGDLGKKAAKTTHFPVDICIINTCTVTEKASMQSRQAIRQAVRAFPNARIIVTGCYAQTQPEEILKIEGVNRVISQEDKPTLLSSIFFPFDKELPTDFWPNAGAFTADEARGSRTRAFLKVQDGCNANCTYCIVPKARGKSRSMPEAQVISNLYGLKQAGYREVVLSGIHLGFFGLDFSPPSTLFALLEKIEGLGITERVRLSSIEPAELSKDIIDLVARSNTFCRHFHIPLQSGDDAILKRMGRSYTRTFFRDLIQNVHGRMPNAAVGIDVLVGFPGESDAAFENTFELIDSLPVSYLHVFPFSPRKSTPAYTMGDKVSPAIIKARAARMRALGEKKRRKFYGTLVGRPVEILMEGAVDASTGLFKGRTSNYVPVYVDNYSGVENQFVEVKVEKALGSRGVLATPILSPGGP